MLGLVRLVRACGSKQILLQYPKIRQGQARKSLWIETSAYKKAVEGLLGQARKSLWIETKSTFEFNVTLAVRLVRACGSKLQ